jgi:dihydroorotase
MFILIKNALILDDRSALHLQKKDLLIQDGVVVEIAGHIETKQKIDHCIESENNCISPGWLDIGTHTGEPGYEHRETIMSLSKAAKVGGYTAIAPFPKANPPTTSKAAIQFLRDQGKASHLQIFPIAALSNNLEGNEMTEMIDLQKNGAIAFSDGLHTIKNSSLLEKALQYTKTTDSLIIHFPLDRSVCPEGMMHEGEMSTNLGMRGIPTMAEKLMVQRDLTINEYAESRLCLYGISTAESLKLIQDTKRESNLDLSAIVCYLNLIFTDEKLNNFDSNLKVLPPLRTGSDRKALVEAIINGEIEMIASNHYPLEEESKKLEFPYADFGASGIETCFSGLMSFGGINIPVETIAKCLGQNPRKLLKVETDVITEGAKANFTVFDPSKKWSYAHSLSLSKNNPLLGKELTGRVLATICENHISVNR